MKSLDRAKGMLPLMMSASGMGGRCVDRVKATLPLMMSGEAGRGGQVAGEDTL